MNFHYFFIITGLRLLLWRKISQIELKNGFKVFHHFPRHSGPQLRPRSPPKLVQLSQKKSNAKSVSCAVVSVSTSQVFWKLVHQVKHRAKEAKPESDDDEYVPPPGSFGGLDEDEDDTAEWVAAASRPVRASTATQSSKVSIYTFSRRCVIATWSVELPQHLYWDQISFSRKKITQETRQQQTSWGCTRVQKVDWRFPPNLSSISWQPKQQGYLGLQITRHCSCASSSLEQSLWWKCQCWPAKNQVLGWSQHCYLSCGMTTCPKLEIYWQCPVRPVSHRVAELNWHNWALCRRRLHGHNEPGNHWGPPGSRQQIAQQWLVRLSQNKGRSGKQKHSGMHYVNYVCPCAKGMQVKRAGCYRGLLIVYTVAQCWVDFEGSIEVPGFVYFNDFPLALSATSVSSLVCTIIGYSWSIGASCSLALGQWIHHQGESWYCEDDEAQ